MNDLTNVSSRSIDLHNIVLLIGLLPEPGQVLTMSNADLIRFKSSAIGQSYSESIGVVFLNHHIGHSHTVQTDLWFD